MNRVAAVGVLLSVFILFLYRGLYHSNLLFAIVITTVFEIALISFNGYEIDKCVQQVLLISIFVLSYEQVFRSASSHIDSLFFKFIRLSYYICLFGLLQEIVYIVNHINISDYLIGIHLNQPLFGSFIRITSTLSEGGYLGTILVPSLIYLFYYNDPHRILGNKKYLILFVALFTVSPFVYFSLFAIFSLRIYKRFKPIKYVVLAILVIVSTIGFTRLRNIETEREAGGIEGIFMRFNDSLDMFEMLSNDRGYELTQYNVSTATLGTGLYIGINAPSRLLGTGLGTQEQNHNLIAGKILSGTEAFASLNKEDGYSLLTRILTEWGFLGIIIYIIFISFFFNKKNIINICVLCVLLCFFLRGGSYVDWGTVYWHFLYFYTSKHKVNAIDLNYKRLINKVKKNERYIYYNRNL